MQQTIQLGQVVQPSVLSQVKAAVKSLECWLGRKSETFTQLCATEEGEEFTHGDVVKDHLWLAVVLFLIGIGGAL